MKSASKHQKRSLVNFQDVEDAEQKRASKTDDQDWDAKTTIVSSTALSKWASNRKTLQHWTRSYRVAADDVDHLRSLGANSGRKSRPLRVVYVYTLCKLTMAFDFAIWVFVTFNNRGNTIERTKQWLKRQPPLEKRKNQAHNTDRPPTY